jgi:hypothetical protein
MGKFLGFLLMVALVCVLAYYAWQHYHTTEVLDSGTVHCQGCLTGERKEAFLRENAGEGPDGQSEHKWDFSRGPDGEKREWSSADDPSYRDPSYPADRPGIATNEPSRPYATDPNADRDRRFGPDTPVPTRDTVPPYPPNGVRFAGSGAYQWYRQGNLTWRVDTVSGRSCIAYATIEEWRKRLVMEHGCGSSI